MVIIRKSFPTDPAHPKEIHHWYYPKGQAKQIASVAYIHYGFDEPRKYRWEILFSGEDNVIKVGSLEEAEKNILTRFKAVKIEYSDLPPVR